MRAVWKGVTCSVVAAAVACSGTSTKQDGFASGDAGNLLGGGSGGGSGGSGGSSGASSSGSFGPNKKLFTKIGPLGCSTALSPNSMAVDRSATAYVNYVADDDSTGQIFQVSTTDASCTGPLLTLPTGWERVGMGYSTNNAGSTAETLYVAGVGAGAGSSVGLGLVDFGIKTVGPIGPFSGSLSGQNAELTGTGDGRLYGFFTTAPVEVAQITKTNGSTQAPVPMTGVPVPNDWAFSFWGGHFYLYTSAGQGAGGGSNVTDYDPVAGTVNTTFMTAIGFDIVGAGVSTCAPTTTPQ